MHNPSTSYLSSTPQLTPPPPARTASWQQLNVTPTRSRMPPAVYVPGPPTPRTPRLRNNTPTPAVSTPGSWVERRRPGQVVDRSLGPPPLEVDLPVETTGSSSSVTASDRRTVSKATTAADSQESFGDRLLSRQLCRDGQQLEAEVPSIQFPAQAKIASRPSQLDGTTSESSGGKSGSPQRQGYCEKLRGSLRSVSSMLSLREKSAARDDKTSRKGPSNNSQTVRPARPLAATQDKPKWWSTASLRTKKGAGAGRNRRQSTRGSLRQLFASTDSSNGTMEHSGSRTSPDATRFDDERHPHSFVGPKIEGDTDSPVEDQFADITAAEIAEENESQAQSVRKDCIVS
ncbi:MAG: hypothetical protein Q9168_007186 [Polycauliona sp. 1 TL-2023]